MENQSNQVNIILEFDFLKAADMKLLLYNMSNQMCLIMIQRGNILEY